MSLKTFLGLKKLTFWEVPLSQYAHVIIDVQAHFCDPIMGGSVKTDAEAKHIATMADEFRAAGVKTFILYYDQHNQGLNHDNVKLHHLTIKPNDVVIPKLDDSAFRRGTKLHSTLKDHGITTLLISGFNAHACVKNTVLDALIGLKPTYPYRAALLEDMIGDNSLERERTPTNQPRGAERHFQEMETAGALRTISSFALQQLAR